MDRLMKINIWTLACLLMGLTACTDSSDELVQKGNEITLKLINHEMSRSAGVPKLNENLIKNADIFFFAYDATTQGPKGNCLYHHQENDLGDDGVQTEHEFSISANNFTDKISYYIYAIANLEIDAEFSGTIDELKAKAATPISVTTGEKGNNGIQDHFVMDGFNNTFTYTKGMTGTTKIPLTRSAAKITLTVNVASSVTVGGATFEPSKTSAMKVRMINGEKNGVVNGEATTSGTLTTGYYSIDQTTKTHSVPFYSYPTNTVGENACYLELMIPWDSSNGTVNNNYYYIIPIETDVKSKPITKLERNHHYIVDVNVSILGSLREEPVTLNPKFLVKDWNTVALDADLKNYRYLWVQEPANGEYWVMNNTEILEIPYTTSHACNRIIVSCTQPNLYNGSNENHKDDFTDKNPGTDPDTDDFYCGFVDGKIVYKHGLDNLYTNSTFDFTPYDITITIQHADDSNFSETIVIKQYPAIYAEADENSDGNDDSNNGYTFVNGYYSNDNGTSHTGLGNQDFFNSVPGLSNSGGNPNMFIFTVTSVEGTNYIIGDPREKQIDPDFINAKRVYNNPNDNEIAWVEAPALYYKKEDIDANKTKRRLEYYFATDVDMTNNNTLKNSRTRNIIAPKFRIASAYGVLHYGDYASEDLEGMKKRCASYQEDGYPAGRWRLPTEAEFRFIISQVNKQPTPTLPQMYIKGANYWCAHGIGEVKDNGTVEMSYRTKIVDGKSTRCVYDDWYWGSERVLTGEAKKTFTWGDEPITR